MVPPPVKASTSAFKTVTLAFRTPSWVRRAVTRTPDWAETVLATMRGKINFILVMLEFERSASDKVAATDEEYLSTHKPCQSFTEHLVIHRAGESNCNPSCGEHLMDGAIKFDHASTREKSKRETHCTGSEKVPGA